MKYWTYAEIKAKIEADLDLEAETFIADDELLGYVNEGIDEAESEIHSLYEDYFLAKQTVSLVSGQEEYDFPSDVYANKVRGIVYTNGSKIYTLKRVPASMKFLEYHEQKVYGSGDIYGWIFINSTPGEPKIVLTPTPTESGPYLSIWYLRNANHLETDTDICDIPEFVHFVIQYAKVRCYEKEGHPLLEKAVSDLEAYREKMNGTLAAMAPDGQDHIEPDLSAYEEMS